MRMRSLARRWMPTAENSWLPEHRFVGWQAPAGFLFPAMILMHRYYAFNGDADGLSAPHDATLVTGGGRHQPPVGSRRRTFHRPLRNPLWTLLDGASTWRCSIACRLLAASK